MYFAALAQLCSPLFAARSTVCTRTRLRKPASTTPIESQSQDLVELIPVDLRSDYRRTLAFRNDVSRSSVHQPQCSRPSRFETLLLVEPASGNGDGIT